MKHCILFTGHMIDAEDRAESRFPARKEDAVTREIYQRLFKYRELSQNVSGIASGACGGDILFHEVCDELGIPTEMYLAMPAKEFKKKSVSFAGKNWDKRFDKLVSEIPVHVLLPNSKNTGMNVYEQTNEWMLQRALASGAENCTLLALWDGGGGYGKGGTEDMIKVAKKASAGIEVIDINAI